MRVVVDIFLHKKIIALFLVFGLKIIIPEKKKEIPFFFFFFSKLPTLPIHHFCRFLLLKNRSH